jgi:hypothetical protein
MHFSVSSDRVMHFSVSSDRVMHFSVSSDRAERQGLAVVKFSGAAPSLSTEFLDGL